MVMYGPVTKVELVDGMTNAAFTAGFVWDCSCFSLCTEAHETDKKAKKNRTPTLQRNSFST